MKLTKVSNAIDIITSKYVKSPSTIILHSDYSKHQPQCEWN